MKRACLFVGALFLISAGLQFNDPDPGRWIAMYAAAGAVSLWAWRSRVPRIVPGGVAAVGALWMALLAPAAFADFRISDLARTMHAENPAIELSREWLGLLLIVGWMVAVAATRSRRAAPGES